MTPSTVDFKQIIEEVSSFYCFKADLIGLSGKIDLCRTLMHVSKICYRNV